MVVGLYKVLRDAVLLLHGLKYKSKVSVELSNESLSCIRSETPLAEAGLCDDDEIFGISIKMVDTRCNEKPVARIVIDMIK
jgi:hypothetical protein